MDAFKRIFVAIDFSAASIEALRQAHQRAVSTGAKLAVCHIVPNELRSNLLFPHLSSEVTMSIPKELERAADAVSNQVAQVLGPSAAVEVMVDHGTPYAEILRSAENWNADLIIMGSHGMTSAAGILLGSVTHKVIRYAPCTVLIVRPAKAAGPIVAGTDFSDPALPAISAAVEETRTTGRPLIVIHSLHLGLVAPSHGGMAFGGAAPMLTEEIMSGLRQNAERKLLEALRQFDANGEAIVTVGPAALALVTAASDRNASLVVVGTRGQTGMDRVLLGSVAETVASNAPCSVLITRLNQSMPGSDVKA